AVMLQEDEERLREAALLITEINLGATAIGTGINAHPAYAALVCQRLAELTRIRLVTAPNLVEATQDAGAYVQLSGVLKRIAVKLSKVCNDLRLLSSGPRAGLGEINLPPVQAGSSIMPGKVNPVIPEVVNQIAFEVIGNDVTVSFAAEAGQLQLNALARHRPQPVQEPDASAERVRHPARALRDRHHREPRAHGEDGAGVDRPRHRAQSLYRLLRRERSGARGPCHRQDRIRPGPGKETPVEGT